MLARCARCQGTFTTDRYGRQSCPHCGSELILPDPDAPQQPAPEAPPQGASAPPPADVDPQWGAPPAPPPQAGAGGPTPPPPGGGFAPPPPPGGGWSPLPPGPPSPPPAPEGDIPAPFAEIGKYGFFRAFLQTWKLMATEPQRFFARVRVDQAGSAVLFGLLATLVGLSVAALFGMVTDTASAGFLRGVMQNAPPESAEALEKLATLMQGGFRVIGFVVALVLDFIGLFLAALVLHAVLLVFQGASRGLGATLTVVGYSFGLNLLFVVPGCGSLIALVWQLVVLIVGLAAVHRTTTGKAALAVFLPGVLVCCCCCFFFYAGVAAFVQGLQGAGGVSNL